MAYRVAIVDDSKTDAEYVQSILSAWVQDRQAELVPLSKITYIEA